MEQLIGGLLRAGVLLASAVVAVGAAIYLARHGAEAPRYGTFRGEPDDLRHLSGILRSATALHGRGLIQLGLVLLIATPIARVSLALYGFARQRDRTYVAVTLCVLGVLAYSLFGSH
jgi:uncharacterized membrane protein